MRALVCELSADASLALGNGCLPIHSPASWDKPECIQVLVETGTDINARGMDGRTALHWVAAADSADQNAVKWLLDHGADDTIEKHDTIMTAWDYAELRASQKEPAGIEIVEIFEARKQNCHV